jgi:4-hydroxy-tetrahydrodipicolinate synthase
MFGGSMVALVTPMRPDGSVDFGSLEGLVEWHVREGTNAIVSVGTTGESATLDFDEHIAVVRRTVEAAKRRVPVIAGTGANSTTEAIDLTKAARAVGVDACLLVTPYYNKPTQEGLFRHYSAVAAAVDIPQILYNVPGRTGRDMLPETVARLSRVGNIVGLKEAVGEPQRIREILGGVADGFEVYSGDDATACESILMGCKGDISVTANVAPRLMSEMVAAAVAGDRQRAKALDVRLEPLHQKLFLEPNPIPVKWALHEMKKIPEGIRLPLTPFDARYHDELRAALRAAGVLS